MSARKSGRIRQKRSFGDDFIDPTVCNNKKSRTKTPPSSSEESSSRRSVSAEISEVPETSSINEEAEEIDIDPNAPTTSSTLSNQHEDTIDADPPPATTSSTVLKQIADTVTDTILKEVKDEMENEEMGEADGPNDEEPPPSIENTVDTVEPTSERSTSQEPPPVLERDDLLDPKKEEPSVPMGTANTPMGMTLEHGPSERPRKIVRVLISRGPNGEIRPQGRYIMNTRDQEALTPFQPPNGAIRQIQRPPIEQRPRVAYPTRIDPVPKWRRNPKWEKMMTGREREKTRMRLTLGGKMVYHNSQYQWNSSTFHENYRNRIPPVRKPQQYLPYNPPGRTTPPLVRSARYPLPLHLSKKQKLLDLAISGRIYRPGPHRVFLGAEEPMKDINTERNTYGRFSIRKVKKVTFMNSKDNQMLEEDSDIEEKRQEEYIRQQQAITQKVMMNQIRIWDYMQTDKFKESIKIKEKATEFEKKFGKPNALAELPEFSDSLSDTNPQLFKNLLDVFRIKYAKKMKKPPPNLDERPIVPTVLSPEPVEVSDGVPSEDEQPVEDEPMKMVNVNYNGVDVEIPSLIQCHKCPGLMRLCMRKMYYRGQGRTYPAYRCIAKGCQTFRSIKKQFDEEIYKRSMGLSRPRPEPESTNREDIRAESPDDQDSIKLETTCEESIDDVTNLRTPKTEDPMEEEEDFEEGFQFLEPKEEVFSEEEEDFEEERESSRDVKEEEEEEWGEDEEFMRDLDFT